MYLPKINKQTNQSVDCSIGKTRLKCIGRCCRCEILKTGGGGTRIKGVLEVSCLGGRLEKKYSTTRTLLCLASLSLFVQRTEMRNGNKFLKSIKGKFLFHFFLFCINWRILE